MRRARTARSVVVLQNWRVAMSRSIVCSVTSRTGSACSCSTYGCLPDLLHRSDAATSRDRCTQYCTAQQRQRRPPCGPHCSLGYLRTCAVRCPMQQRAEQLRSARARPSTASFVCVRRGGGGGARTAVRGPRRRVPFTVTLRLAFRSACSLLLTLQLRRCGESPSILRLTQLVSVACVDVCK